MIDPNWTRWIKSSINVYFNDNKIPNIPLLFEPQETMQNEYIGLRINGPSYEEVSRNEFEALVGIGIIIQTLVTSNINNLAIIQGKMETLCRNDIFVRKYNDGEATLGCLRLQGRIISTNYGKVQQDVTLEQASIECEYKMELEI